MSEQSEPFYQYARTQHCFRHWLKTKRLGRQECWPVLDGPLAGGTARSKSDHFYANDDNARVMYRRYVTPDKLECWAIDIQSGQAKAALSELYGTQSC